MQDTSLPGKIQALTHRKGKYDREIDYLIY